MLEIINDDSKTVVVSGVDKSKSEERGKIKHFAMSSFTKLDDNSDRPSNSRRGSKKSNFLEVNSPRDDPEYIR